jgi:hypothetical protein
MTLSSMFVLAALLVAVVVSAAQRARLGVAVPPPLAPPRGSASAGVRYAFTTAFAPWAKESARTHLPSYLAGIVYHLAVFAMLALLLASVLVPVLPPGVARVAGTLFAVGTLCGVALLIKRALNPALRALSVPDDVLANALVTGALAAGAAFVVAPAARAAFQVIGGLVLLYAPLGKLRHMLFLFTSRRFWGEWHGRRGVRPAPQRLAGRDG